MLFSKALELARKHQLDAPNTPIDHLAQQLGMDIESLPQNDARVCELVRIQDRPAGAYQIRLNANLDPTDRDLAVARAIAHALMHPHLVGDLLAWDADGDSGLDAEEDWYARNMAHRLLGRKQQDNADPPPIVLALRHYRMYPPAHTTSPEASPMLNPPHLGELVRESMDEVGWNVTETAAHLGCARGTLSRLLNGKTGVSANMALALEAIGWGTADHWMRMQASHELAQARRARGWQEDIRAHEEVA